MDLMTDKIYMQLVEYINNDNIIKFYSLYQWRKLRALAKRRDMNECQMCKREGRYMKAEMVHHIKHVKDYPSLALNLNNLETLCNACHNKMHPEKSQSQNSKSKFENDEMW